MMTVKDTTVQQPFTLDTAPIEVIVALLREIAAPCDCELGRPTEDCQEPLDRWERRWAESR